MIELIDKEEILEVEDKIERALQKDKQVEETNQGMKKPKEVHCDMGPISKDKGNPNIEKELNKTDSSISVPKGGSSKCTNIESTQTMVTPPPSIDKAKDNSKMV